MQSYIRNMRHAMREICKGSGFINFWSIVMMTFLVYIVVMFVSNRDLFFLLSGIMGQEDFQSPGKYLNFLEDQTIQDVNLLIPLVVIILFYKTIAGQLQSNIQLRLLPIEPSLRVTALVLVMLIVAGTSMVLIHLLDFGVAYYLRYQFLSEVVRLQESTGDLYRQLYYNNIFSPHYDYSALVSYRHSITFVFVAPISGLILLNAHLLFGQYSWIKVMIIIGLIVLAGVVLRTMQNPPSSPTVSVKIWWPPITYFPMLLICMLYTFFYLLRERED